MTHTLKSGLPAMLGSAILIVGLAAFTGCRMPGQAQPDRTMSMATNYVDFWIESSRQEVLVGEVVTLMVRDQDTAGREINIEWSTTGGELSTERNNRIARLQFDSPGEYTVTGRMYADDIVISDSIDISVRRLR